PQHAPTPGDRSAPPPRGRRPRPGLRLAARATLVLGLLGLTAWNLTRSAALADALAAEGRGDYAHAATRALDHPDRRPWRRGAARVAARGLGRLGFREESEPYCRRAAPPGREDLLVRAFALFRANRGEE